MRRYPTLPPAPRKSSYRDPDLSDQWLHEAEWRARYTRNWPKDARKIILRLVKELRRINRETKR